MGSAPKFRGMIRPGPASGATVRGRGDGFGLRMAEAGPASHALPVSPPPPNDTGERQRRTATSPIPSGLPITIAPAHYRLMDMKSRELIYCAAILNGSSRYKRHPPVVFGSSFCGDLASRPTKAMACSSTAASSLVALIRSTIKS